MTPVERLGLALLHRFDPETAHGLSLTALRCGLAPLPGPVTSARLNSQVAGLDMPNPVGLAAGYDKNAVALGPLSRAGFGFLEVGAATPLPQEGNPKPRLFRLTEDRAAINRFGFNNQGAVLIATRLAARKRGSVPVGINLGANKTSTDRAADFAQVLALCGPHVDFATVNVSSPNTEKLRDLQGPAALTALLAQVMQARVELARPTGPTGPTAPCRRCRPETAATAVSPPASAVPAVMAAVAQRRETRALMVDRRHLLRRSPQWLWI